MSKRRGPRQNTLKQFVKAVDKYNDYLAEKKRKTTVVKEKKKLEDSKYKFTITRKK